MSSIVASHSGWQLERGDFTGFLQRLLVWIAWMCENRDVHSHTAMCQLDAAPPLVLHWNIATFIYSSFTEIGGHFPSISSALGWGSYLFPWKLQVYVLLLQKSGHHNLRSALIMHAWGNRLREQRLTSQQPYSSASGSPSPEVQKRWVKYSI